MGQINLSPMAPLYHEVGNEGPETGKSQYDHRDIGLEAAVSFGCPQQPKHRESGHYIGGPELGLPDPDTYWGPDGSIHLGTLLQLRTSANAEPKAVALLLASV